jgi:hypothetical protein
MLSNVVTPLKFGACSSRAPTRMLTPPMAELHAIAEGSLETARLLLERPRPARKFAGAPTQRRRDREAARSGEPNRRAPIISMLHDSWYLVAMVGVRVGLVIGVAACGAGGSSDSVNYSKGSEACLLLVAAEAALE